MAAERVPASQHARFRQELVQKAKVHWLVGSEGWKEGSDLVADGALEEGARLFDEHRLVGGFERSLLAASLSSLCRHFAGV